MYRCSSRLNYLVAVAVVATLVGVAGSVSAQGYQLLLDDTPQHTSYDTPSLQCAEPWPEGSILVWGDARTWELDNWTFAAGARMSVGEDMDAEATLFHMNTSGEDAVNGVVRDSEATLLGLNFKWVARRTENLTISVIPGAEFPIGDIKGTNTAIPATASSDDFIPVLAVPFEFSAQEDTIFRLVPRYVGFDEAPELADGTRIRGFGDVLALGAAVIHDFGEYSVMADGTFVADGHNSIDDGTNAPSDEFVWSVGGAWHPIDRDMRVDLFVTNAAGPTAASSMIAAPDSSIGVGVKVSGEF
ncbi:MAG: hypothetical protein ACOCX2_05465 [Armatimonadota bacterium]